jgi:N-acetylmuramoyl-L-alanine amidase
VTTLFRVEGKMSTFGGPADKGMKPNEGLGLFNSEQDMINHGLGDFLLSRQDAGAPGLGRRLDPKKPYLACRWWETDLKRELLRTTWAWVENPKTGTRLRARPVDSGPAEWTNRVADLSPGLADALKLKTNDVCRVTITDEATEFRATFEHTLSDLPTAASGPRVFTTAEWEARPAKVSYFPKHTPEGIVVHNTEGANRAAYSDFDREKQAAFEDARSIQNSHMDVRGWSDTGQHFLISQGGVVTEGRHGTLEAARAALVVRGAHAPGANDQYWGIEIAGDNRAGYVVTSQQWDTLISLCVWLCQLSGKTLKIEPHDKFVSTTCPGKIKERLPALRTAVKAGL